MQACFNLVKAIAAMITCEKAVCFTHFGIPGVINHGLNMSPLSSRIFSVKLPLSSGILPWPARPSLIFSHVAIVCGKTSIHITYYQNLPDMCSRNSWTIIVSYYQIRYIIYYGYLWLIVALSSRWLRVSVPSRPMDHRYGIIIETMITARKKNVGWRIWQSGDLSDRCTWCFRLMFGDDKIMTQWQIKVPTVSFDNMPGIHEWLSRLLTRQATIDWVWIFCPKMKQRWKNPGQSGRTGRFYNFREMNRKHMRYFPMTRWDPLLLYNIIYTYGSTIYTHGGVLKMGTPSHHGFQY